MHLAMNGVRTHIVVMGTDCTGSCKSNYHTITTATTPGENITRIGLFYMQHNRNVIESGVKFQ